MMRKSFVAGITLVLSACGGSSSNNGNATGALTGQLTDLGLEGISYQTQSQTGVTDSKGRFSYMPGETISFTLGSLSLAENVPTAPYLTMLDFSQESRDLLKASGINQTGMSDHRPVEKLLFKKPEVANLTRFLMTLDEDRSVSEGSNLRYPSRFTEQMDEQLRILQEAGRTLDFTVSQTDFEKRASNSSDGTSTEDRDSPANAILGGICFFPVGDSRCDAPPTDEEIARAPDRPEDPELIDKNTKYKEDLTALAKRIKDSKRNIQLTTADNVEKYLAEQVNAYNAKLGEPFFLSEDALIIPPGDQGIRTLSIRSFKGSVELDNLEVLSLNPAAVTIHSVSAQLNQFQLFATGEKGSESTVLVNFRLPSDYRWITKSLRVRIE